METLDNLRLILVMDLNEAESKSIIVARMCGLATLPDELFAEILFLSAMDDSGSINVKHSLHLSHVNQRFRRLALATGNLWTTITLTSRCSTAFVAACISRSGDRLLDILATVDISSQASEGRLSDFIFCITPVAHRWQSLQFDFEYGPGRQRREVIRNMGGVLATLNHLSLPKLQRLEIKHKSSLSPLVDFGNLLPQGVSLLAKPFFGATWSVPKLKTLN